MLARYFSHKYASGISALGHTTHLHMRTFDIFYRIIRRRFYLQSLFHNKRSEIPENLPF